MNTEVHQKAEGIARRAKARNRFAGQIELKEKHDRPCFSGVICQLENIEVEYNPEFPLHETSAKDAFGRTLDAIVEHEIVHKGDGEGRGCPGTQEDDLNLVLTPMSEVLAKKGFPNIPFGSQGHTLYTYFANLYSDFVVNTIVADNRGSLGLFLDHDDMACASGGLNPLFEAFVKLQAMVYPNKEGVSMMLKHFKQDEKAKKAVKNFLERTKLMDVPRERRASYLADKSHWKETSAILAEEFSELIDKQNPQKSPFVLIGGNDYKYLDGEDLQMEIAIQAYGKKGDVFEPPPFMDNNSALRSLYRKFARKMDIRTKSHSVETQRPVSYVARRQFDFAKDPVERLKYGVNERGKLEAEIGRYPLIVRSRYQVSPGSFPEVRFGMIDCSGSTKESLTGSPGKILNPWASNDGQWSDTSIYHYEILTFMGLVELFRRRGTLKSSNVKLAVFSGQTRVAKSLADAEELVLHPEFGGTVMDKTALEEMFKGRGSLVYTISDGDVQNWSAVRDTVIEGAKRHHYFHYQIGSASRMYNDLKEEGLYTILDDGRKAPQTLIDLTQREVFGA